MNVLDIHAKVNVWKSENKSQFLPCKLQIWLLPNEQSHQPFVGFLKENNKIYRFTQGGGEMSVISFSSQKSYEEL